MASRDRPGRGGACRRDCRKACRKGSRRASSPQGAPGLEVLDPRDPRRQDRKAPGRRAPADQRGLRQAASSCRRSSRPRRPSRCSPSGRGAGRGRTRGARTGTAGTRPRRSPRSIPSGTPQRGTRGSLRRRRRTSGIRRRPESSGTPRGTEGGRGIPGYRGAGSHSGGIRQCLGHPCTRGDKGLARGSQGAPRRRKRRSGTRCPSGPPTGTRRRRHGTLQGRFLVIFCVHIISFSIALVSP